MSASVPYVGRLEHVREVALHGTTELGYWKQRLADESLVCADLDGRARLSIVASDSRWLGMPFCELAIALHVSTTAFGRRRVGFFFLRAFQSSRSLAFCERTFFGTPYEHADVRVSAEIPAHVRLTRKGKSVLRAEMRLDPSASTREPLRSAEEAFEGPVFLPSKRERERTDEVPRSAVFEPSIQPGRPSKLFFAALRGRTETYPFLEGVDALALEPTPELPVLGELVDARFRPLEWAIRRDAAHARSRTYDRARALAEPAR